ncbi:8-oxoguanine deaminase [Marinitenerispora sediminis]|uniref:8-oxoguanine deaminase n=1 Tax=Marinitenerispora sediminis TaxID=1931232 RepID=A0A368SZM0_9ACTN|nr:8-oxoguanine deaminase [Marinitenerispora sediminis]RCV49860.1 8-oxoguanine deaminase [Marinitenerispora sediminis]RCV50891.1 8-oxoguanine deaminase [Marinitenerispora sediminis]RCV51825.1 8-oxoguanine deaminase [Marinitenerispora sediminis]
MIARSDAPLVIDGAHVATVSGPEYPSGHIVVADGRVAAVGPGPAPDIAGAARVDGAGCLATPGLVNTHHHLYQWATQGLVPDGTLFEWLVASYPVWARLDAEAVADTTTAGLAWLALSGCSTASDHHYVFPRGRGDIVAAEVAAARAVGVRLDLARGSMDRGVSRGGLPPDAIVEERDAALEATAAAIEEHHDRGFDSMTRLAVAPCSPFSVSRELMTGAATLARALGVRMHTHLAETVEEEERCQAEFGCTPVEYAEKLGWLGPDVWLAHAVHLSDSAIARIAATGTGVAHCPTSNARLGAGIARVSELLAAGVSVGLGVDGPASSELTSLVGEARQALLMARARRGPAALSARQALEIATLGGARCLGRQAELGSLEVGKLADIALWRVDGFGRDVLPDPVVALVFGPPPPLERLLVGGRTVVERGELRTVAADAAAAAGRRAHRALTGEADRR